MNYFSLEAEQSVIGSILKEPELIQESILTSDEFYSAQHRRLFEVLADMRDKSQVIDLVTVVTELGEEVADIGGVSYLSKMTSSIATIDNFANHERIIRDKYLMRTGMQKIKEVHESGIDDPNEFISELLDLTEEIGSNTTGDHWKHINTGVMEHFEILSDKKYNNKSTGYSTAGTDLDHITGKWQEQTLNIVAARPSVGKTVFMLNNAVRNAKEGVTVAMFSLEQPDVQLYDRMIAAECNIDGDRIRSGKLLDEEWEKYTLGLSNLVELDIWIDDRPGLSIHEIRAAVRKLKKKRPNLIVYIDYLQLITGGNTTKGKSRNEEVGYISSTLKQMARENKCPVISLAQLSRSVEQRQDKRPMLSDLRESGNIEQDADIVAFLYRDDYYNQETEKKNIIEIIVAKNRNGQVGTAEMVNHKNYGKFMNLDRAHY